MKRKYDKIVENEEESNPLFKRTMHPRNRYYKNPPNFKQMAEKDENFNRFVTIDEKGNYKIDFQSLPAQKALTQSLLLLDFNIKWDIPTGYLIPPVPVRSNYIHWIEDIIMMNEKVIGDQIVGIDIGTGANLIYPLLGSSMNSKWKWIASDIKKESIGIAQSNIDINKLGEVIELQLNDEKSPPLSTIVNKHKELSFTFCLCNPPFYSEMSEAILNPYSASTGMAHELVTDGGEVTFISNIIQDSNILKEAVKFYTVMVGKKSSLNPLIKLLKELNVNYISTTEFVQGQTSRWGLAWSFIVPVGLINEKDKIPPQRPIHPKRNVEIWNLALSDTSNEFLPQVVNLHEGKARVYSCFEDPLSSLLIKNIVIIDDKISVYSLTADALTKEGDDSPLFKFGLIISENKESCCLTFEAKFIEGSDRAAFWRYVSEVKANVNRSSRKWRRKIKKE